MKKIYLILFSILCFFTFGEAKANTLESINTTVDIDQNGNGHVTEIWKLNADEGTEIYHSFGNMEDRKITDFTASRDGQIYNAVSNWNIDWSKSQKNNKNGINYTDDGLELCWGIEYGFHTYTIQYTIENLVWQYDNNQVLYFTFLPKDMDPAPNIFNLTIKVNEDPSNIKYSSYGFDSTNTIQNGGINFKSNGAMNSNEYVVALVGFPNGTFIPTITKSGTYEDVANEALEGAKLNERNNLIDNILPIIILILFCGIAIIIFIKAIRSKDRYDETEFIIPKDINNFRDIPFNKDVMQAYFIGFRKNIMKRENIMGAILLKWIKEEKIKMIPTEGGILDFNKNDNYYLDLTNLENVDNKAEERLKSILLEAADSNKTLTPKTFKKWCKVHYERINNWLEDLPEISRDILIENGYIEKSEENYTKNKTRKVYKLTSKLADEFIKLKGLKKFLEDMTLIDDKKAIEVHMWDEYLIFAQSFGIADKVAKQFKDFHPVEYDENMIYYNNYIWINTFTLSSINAARNAASAASSGGSFSGGGMSSGGFSSGGGVR